MTTRLHSTLLLLYKMQPEEVAALSGDLLDQRKDVWKRTLTRRAREYGVPGASANAPRGGDLAELKAMSNEDAKSIAATWERDVERQIERLFNENRRGNRNYYIKNMERWARDREQWKSVQIANVTERGTAFYAETRFRQENDVTADRYIYQGPAPVSENCVRRTGAGVVDYNYMRRNPVPNHPNCPHEWELVTTRRLDPATIWVG